jgi:hypothetical protein
MQQIGSSCKVEEDLMLLFNQQSATLAFDNVLHSRCPICKKGLWQSAAEQKGPFAFVVLPL